MMRQSEFKMRFDPELGKFTRQHIYGEGITDVFKSVGSKLFGKTVKSAAKKGVEKALTTAATKTGEHVGKKAGDKIVQLLSADCRVILTIFQPFVPRITFNKKGQEIYLKNYLKPYKWMYLNEVVERSNNSQQQTGHFRITNAISKPRHVFVFAIHSQY